MYRFESRSVIQIAHLLNSIFYFAPFLHLPEKDVCILYSLVYTEFSVKFEYHILQKYSFPLIDRSTNGVIKQCKSCCLFFSQYYELNLTLAVKVESFFLLHHYLQEMLQSNRLDLSRQVMNEKSQTVVSCLVMLFTLSSQGRVTTCGPMEWERAML